jgi:uncharacterized protein YbbC (DUF1343 family)
MTRTNLSILLLLFISVATLHSQNVKTGIEVLQQQNFDILKGKRVGLITNPTGVNSRLESTIDLIFNAPGVELAALYGPEHGVRGDFDAGEEVSSNTDPKTGVPVFSLYGKNHKPSPEMLKGIDILVYDIQDIGSRSYTFISTMGLAMEAAAENNIEFVVLDRPNPLGGEKIEGPITEPAFTSFVSQFPIPYIHGFTVGELAMYLNNNGLLKNGLKCNLTVVVMEGWHRSMTFEDTGLPWVASSPHIPNASTAAFYPITGILGELYVINIGVGYTMPFQLFGAEWVDAEKLASELNKLQLDGLIFRPIHYKPYYGSQKGKTLHGVQVHITDESQAALSPVQFYVLQEMHKLYPEKNVFQMCEPSRHSMFDKVCGTDKIRKEFEKQFDAQAVLKLWYKDTEPFRQKAKQYYLYK